MGFDETQSVFDRREGGERRKKKTDFRRRKIDRRGKTFHYERMVYLTDTNAFGNMYFAQYFDFMGEAREELLKLILGAKMQDFAISGITLLTVGTSLSYKKPLYLFDSVRIEITLKKLTKMKICLNFKFFDESRTSLYAQGDMTLGASKEGRAIVIPEILKQGLVPFL